MHPSAAPALSERTLAEIARLSRRAIELLHRHDLDFGLGGARSLVQACAQAGLEAQELVDELERELARGQTSRAWEQEPLEQLALHLLDRCHEPLRQEHARLLFLARAIAAREEPHDLALVERLAELERFVADQLALEEQQLLPALCAGAHALAAEATRALIDDHHGYAQRLRDARRLARARAGAPGADRVWAAIADALVELERRHREHAHLEIHVLLPKAFGAGERDRGVS